MGRKAQPLEERFWSRVDKRGLNECWPWLGSFVGGYGQISVGSRTDGTRRVVKAHRLAYELSVGPLGDAQARHSCDNPPCCNPAHIEPGSNQDNVDDRTRRGRGAAGARNGNAKLDPIAVARIRLHYAEGARQVDLADSFGVTQSMISKVVRGDYWKAA